jgi:trehalose 6-phosphate synthase/phosphatase
VNAETISTLYRERFSERSLIVVSNREPYIHRKTRQGIKVDTPAGGLTSALDPVMCALGGTWIAWGSGSADRDTVDDDSKVMVPPDDPRYTLKRVWLDQKEIDGFYYGYANQALWPLCHMLIDKARFRTRHWRHYYEVNRKFADAIIPEVRHDNDIVWIQDYHFTLLPYMLRSHSKQLTIAMFWHIPWPPWEIFRVIPQRIEILKGMLGCDMIGFHVDRYAENFLECVENELQVSSHSARMAIPYDGREIRLKSFPISIDFDSFESMTLDRKTETKLAGIRNNLRLHGKYVGIGVDRLDYSKGIVERIRALNLFFKRFPEYRERFTFIQVAVPSRTKIQEYNELKVRIERMIDEINADFGTENWTPVVYYSTNVPQKELVNYYRLADIAIVSSIVDGMNLVAKEFIASQVEEKGVLILSEFVGAVAELDQAIIINPFDVEQFANMIRRGIEMPLAEKKRRMQKMRAYVRTHNIFDWIDDNLNAVNPETVQ